MGRDRGQDRRHKTGDGIGETGEERQHTEDRTRETGVRKGRKETGDGRRLFNLIFRKFCAFNLAGEVYPFLTSAN